MSLKKIVRCKDCANRAYDLGIGFTSKVIMMCTDTGREVNEDDGCTFGFKGDSLGYVSRDCEVSLSGHEAVNGGW